MGDTLDLVAWIDESGSNAILDPGTYIMAAAITMPHQVDALRQTMRGLLLPGQVKLHWRDEQPSRHSAIAEAIASAEIEHLIIVTNPHPIGHSTERRRRLNLRTMLPELVGLGVTRTILESRGAADDKRDRAMLDHLRQQRPLTSTLRMDHRIGRTEPALWVADALCGMVTSLRCGDDTHFRVVASKATIHEVLPT